MPTTIQVEKPTVQLLNRLKEKMGASSYDKVIRKLAEKEEQIPESLFGVHPEMKPFKRDRRDFHEI